MIGHILSHHNSYQSRATIGKTGSRRSKRESRAEILEDAPLRLAPENEQGVVFLFAHLAKKWRLRVEEIRQEFPDCIAYQKTHGREKRVRINGVRREKL
jgi:hypothetical protein